MLISPMRTLGYMLGAGPARDRLGRAHLPGARPRAADRRAAGAPPLPAGDGRVELRGVTLTFEGATQPALRDIDLEVEAGTTVALVGGTGSGKTALVSLLPRLYDVTEGAVQIDGADVRTVDPAVLRHEIAVVTDDPFLFSATVHDNIAYARPGRDARGGRARPRGAAQADGFIARAARRLRHARRRARADALGRAAPADRDRPRDRWPTRGSSSSTTRPRRWTPRPSRRSSARCAEVMAGRTTFVIAHRLSTIALADEIVVLEDGQDRRAGTPRRAAGAARALYREIVEKGMPDQVFLTRKPRRSRGGGPVSAPRLDDVRRRLRETGGRGRKLRGLVELLRALPLARDRDVRRAGGRRRPPRWPRRRWPSSRSTTASAARRRRAGP